ncbi:uncharacterized protein ARMOST_14915 [Armillaria ostoyae]|uniref:Uncharacterized protein n=1 Tax=Armillaria ostoyae TaxID=47428 RepID=A0A284RRY0_ARMOS|nr:uncharacterized protein ARMOST_14915 [Armillaria ostoyae]
MVNTRIQKHAHSPGDGNASKAKAAKTDVSQDVAGNSKPEPDGQSSPLSTATDSTCPSNSASHENLTAPAETVDGARNRTAHGGFSDDKKNPYEGILRVLIPVPRIRDLLKAKDIADPVPTFNLIRYYRNNRAVIKRVLLLAFAPSKTNLMNLALSDPTECSVSSDKIVHGLPYAQSFFLIGSVVYSDLFGGDTTKQICMRPLDFSFSRVTAVVGRVFGTAPGGTLFFNGYRGGMSFMSWMKPESGRMSQTVPPHAVNGKRHVVRPWDEPVPVFDCRAGFKLSQYHLAPKCFENPEEGDLVFIICTVGWYKNMSYNVASFNVQVVLKIADGPTSMDGGKLTCALPAYFGELHGFGVSGEELPATDAIDEMEADEDEMMY